jgi:hypothetical protein
LVIERRRNEGRARARSRSELAKELEKRALAHGKKPFANVKDVARGTPEDADELLAAIKELREDGV